MIRKRPDGDASEAPALRELPHNLDLERAVLAVLLDGRHPTAMHTVRQHVAHALAFFQRDHRIVYQACLELDDQGHRIDAQGVAELLSRYDFRAAIETLRRQQIMLETDQLEGLPRDRLRELWRREDGADAAGYEDSALAAVGGFNAITDLAASFAPVAGLERNVQLLVDYHLKRRLITRLTGLVDKAYRTPESFSQLVEAGGQTVLDLGKAAQISSVHPLASVIDETLTSIAERQSNPDEGVRTGIADLDERLTSLRPGGLYVLAARPGAGKTSLALNVVGNIAGRHRQGVLFFSLEVDRVDLVKKLLSAEAAIDFRSIETGMVDQEQSERLMQAASEFKEWRLDLMDVSDLTVQGLRSIVRRAMLEQGGKLKLIVIDYLQLLGTRRADANEYEKVSEISRVLKVLARELRVPVVALSQMSRESEKGVSDQPREPRLSDLRGSGSIEQDADAVLFIHHVKSGNAEGGEERRRMKLIVAKNRFGPTGFCDMWFFPAKMRFHQMAKGEVEAEADEGGAAPGPQRRDRGPRQQQDAAPRHERVQGKPTEEEDLF